MILQIYECKRQSNDYFYFQKPCFYLKDISQINADELDAVIFPGGFGVAKNLSDYAMAGSDCSVNPDVYRLIAELRVMEKPIGAICIAPVMMAKILGEQEESANMTIGYDETTSTDILSMGSKHVECPVSEMIIDKEKKIVTTPAYMEAKSIKEAADGIEKLINQILSMI